VTAFVEELAGRVREVFAELSAYGVRVEVSLGPDAVCG